MTLHLHRHRHRAAERRRHQTTVVAASSPRVNVSCCITTFFFTCSSLLHRPFLPSPPLQWRWHEIPRAKWAAGTLDPHACAATARSSAVFRVVSSAQVFYSACTHPLSLASNRILQHEICGRQLLFQHEISGRQLLCPEKNCVWIQRIGAAASVLFISDCTS